MCFRNFIWAILFLPLVFKAKGQSDSAAGPFHLLLDRVDVSGNISRDGKWISYRDWNNGGDLAVREIMSGKASRVSKSTKNSPSVGRSIFSPTADRIAYEGDDIKIAYLGKDSSITITKNANLFDWSPDGKYLLIYNYLKKQLGLLEISTGKFRNLFSTTDPIFDGSVSPDGKFIAFSTATSDFKRHEIWIISTLNKKQRLFVAGDENHYGAKWASDGNSIIYFSDSENKPRVWIKSLDENNPGIMGSAIAELPDAAILPMGITSNGDLYIGTEDRGGLDVYYGLFDPEKQSISDSTKIISPPYHGSRRAVFSPSSDKIAFMQKGRGYFVHPGWQTPVVHNLINGTEKSYPISLTLRDEPLWSSDGKNLYFAAPPEGSVGESAGLVWSFYELDLVSGKYSKIGNAASAGLIRMSGATANSIFYISDYYGKTNIASINSFEIASKTNHLIYQIQNNSFHDASLSPDESQIVFAANESDGSQGLYLLKLGTTDPHLLTKIRTGRAQLMWFSSGDAILSSGRINNKQNIWRIPIDGSEPQGYNLPSSNVSEVRLSPDGRRIAFTIQKRLPNQILYLNIQKILKQ